MKQKRVIHVQNLVKKYGRKTILNNVNLSINVGERVGFVAANGTGKSTLMEIMAEIRPITSGKVYLDPKSKLGIQFQESRYPFGVTVKSMISFYLDIYNIKLTKKELQKQLKFFQLDDLYKRQIVMLSGGQQQRVNLFLALCNNPDIWFLDEVTTGLDIKFKTIILNYIDELLSEEKTLLLVSHNSQELDHLCTRLVVLDEKMVVCDLSKDTIIKSFESVTKFVEFFFHDLDNKKPAEKRRIILDIVEKNSGQPKQPKQPKQPRNSEGKKRSTKKTPTKKATSSKNTKRKL